MRVECSCGKKLKVGDALAGKKIKCPACGAVILAQEPAPEPPPEETEEEPASQTDDADDRDDADEEEERPRKKKKNKKKKKSGSISGGTIAIIGAGLLGVALLVVAIVLLTRETSRLLSPLVPDAGPKKSADRRADC